MTIKRDLNLDSGLIRRKYAPDADQKNRPLILGVDPGFSGAIAVIDIDKQALIDLIDFPTFHTPSKSRKSGYMVHLDIHALSTMIDFYAPMTSIAVVESPFAMPRQGLSSTFRFGKTCGQIEGVLAGHYIPVIPVTPQVWKCAMGLSSDKMQSIKKAKSLFPDFKHLWNRKCYNDRAEAVLLATYGVTYLQKLISFSRK